MRKLLSFAAAALLVLGFSAGAQAAGYVLLDKGKKAENFPAAPKRVVVMDYSTLDTMDELGLSSAVIAVPKMHLPKYLEKFRDKKYEDVGGVMEFDIEKIYKLKPDFIVISNRQLKSHEKLSKIAPTVNVNIDSRRYMDSFRENTLLTGRIWNKEAEAKQLISKVDTAVNRLRAEASDRGGKALLVMFSAGRYSAFGSGSRFGIIYDAFGVAQADGGIQVSNHGKAVNSEYIAKINPDYFFVVDRDAVVEGKASPKKEVENTLIRTTKAFRNGKIGYLPADHWYLANGGAKSLLLMVNDIHSVISK